MNTSKKRLLLTGGRAPATLDLIRKFSRAGHTVFVVDSIPFYLCKSSCYVQNAFVIHKPVLQFDRFMEDLLGIVIDYRIDVIIPTCEEVFWVAKGKVVLEQHCIVFCEPLEILWRLHHKGEFIKLINQKGLQGPQTETVTSIRQLECALGRFTQFVVKPAYSRFASKVLVSNHDLEEIMRIVPSENNPYIIQNYLEGCHYCSYAVVIEGSIKAMSIYKSSMTAGLGATIAFEHSDHDLITGWMDKFFKESTFTGQFAFDFVINSDGLVLPLECNPRATSGVHLFDEQLITAMLGEVKQVKPSRQKRMLVLAVLMYGWRGQRFREFVRTLFTYKDVIFSSKDLLPSIYQLFSYVYFGWMSRAQRISTIEASTVDIEWNGE